MVGEERCASFEALLRAFNLWPNARLKAISPPAFQSVGRTRKQREREVSGFAARLSRWLFSRLSYTDLMGLECKRACSQSSQMRTSISLPRVLSLPG